MTPEEAAWAAGLFEGEGCLYRYDDSRGPYTRWQLRLSMSDQDVIQRLHEVTGMGTAQRFRPPSRLTHWKTLYVWQVTLRHDVRRFLTEVRPWLGARRGAKVDEFFAWDEVTPSKRIQTVPSRKRGQ